MLEVQIRTPVPESCVFGAINEIIDEAAMDVKRLTRIDGTVKGLLKIKANKVGEIISSLPSYCEGAAISSKEADVLVKEHSCIVAHLILNSGSILINAKVQDGNIFWSVICDDDSFIRLMSELESSGTDFEILYKGSPESGEKSRVTYREEELLRIALEKGYFDFPKRIKLEALASNFGIAPSTLSEILRRGQKKVLEKYFGKK